MYKISENKKQLIYLATIQAGNAIIPLFAYPYLLFRMGADKFAPLATLEAAALIVLIISLYSFDVTGIKKINHAKTISDNLIKKTYYTIIYARILIFSSLTILLLIPIYFLEENLRLASFAWLLLPLGVVLQSTYFYQATSNNFPLALFVIIPRIGSLVCVFVYANENTSLILASSLISLSYLISGASSFLYILTTIGFSSPKILIFRSFSFIIKGKELFIGNISVMLYRGSNIFLLNSLDSSAIAISAYAVSEKYIKMLQALTFPLTQIYSVRFTREVIRKKVDSYTFRKLLWSNTKSQVLVAATLCTLFLLTCFISSTKLNEIISNKSIELTVIMIPSILFGIINYMYGTIGFSLINLEKEYAKIILITGIVIILISATLIKFYSSNGAAIAYCLGEIILSVLFVIRIYKFKKI